MFVLFCSDTSCILWPFLWQLVVAFCERISAEWNRAGGFGIAQIFQEWLTHSRLLLRTLGNSSADGEVVWRRLESLEDFWRKIVRLSGVSDCLTQFRSINLHTFMCILVSYMMKSAYWIILWSCFKTIFAIEINLTWLRNCSVSSVIFSLELRKRQFTVINSSFCALQFQEVTFCSRKRLGLSKSEAPLMSVRFWCVVAGRAVVVCFWSAQTGSNALPLSVSFCLIYKVITSFIVSIHSSAALCVAVDLRAQWIRFLLLPVCERTIRAKASEIHLCYLLMLCMSGLLLSYQLMRMKWRCVSV